MSTGRTRSGPATERLKQLVRAELTRQGVSEVGAARAAALPKSVFQSLLRLGKRPTIDRADELCKALGISMMIGVEDPRRDVRQGETRGDN